MSDLRAYLARIDITKLVSGDRLFVYSMKCPNCGAAWFKGCKGALKNRRLTHTKCPARVRYPSRLIIKTALRYSHAAGRPCDAACWLAGAEDCSCCCGGRFHGAGGSRMAGRYIDAEAMEELQRQVATFNEAHARRTAARRFEEAADYAA